MVRTAARTGYFLRDGEPEGGGLPGLAGGGLISHSLSYHPQPGSREGWGMAARLSGQSRFPDKLIVTKQVQDQARNISQQVKVWIRSKDRSQGQPFSRQVHRGEAGLRS